MIAKKEDIILVNAKTFYEKFKFHKDKGNIRNTEQVLLRDLDYYERKCSHFFMLKDYSAGVALETNGNIISIFNGGQYKGVGKLLLEKAVECGGNKLECNDVAQLRYIYSKYGFTPISTAPLNINDIYYDILKSKENNIDHGTMLLFWLCDKKHYNEMINNPGKFSISYNVKKFDTEKEAEEFRDAILEEIKNGSLSSKFKEYISTIIQLKHSI